MFLWTRQAVGGVNPQGVTINVDVRIQQVAGRLSGADQSRTHLSTRTNIYSFALELGIAEITLGSAQGLGLHAQCASVSSDHYAVPPGRTESLLAL